METTMKKICFSPFSHNSSTVQKAMLDVIIALIPAIIASIYFFGVQALILLLATVVSASLFEWIARKIMKKENSIWDCSAIVTGILLALTLPVSTPISIAILGSFIAIIFIKQFFGGLGCNIFNPAIAARGILLISFSIPLTTWTEPNKGLYPIASSTPLVGIKEIFKLFSSGDSASAISLIHNITSNPNTIWNLLIGNTSGSLGETSIIALLIGGVYLALKKRIHLEIPMLYIGTCFMIAWIIAYINGLGIIFSILHILSGGLFLGAIFMATDWVTKPLTRKGRIIYAIALGTITMIIRLKGNYPEGVLFSILIMNMFVPLIDRHSKKRIFGKLK